MEMHLGDVVLSCVTLHGDCCHCLWIYKCGKERKSEEIQMQDSTGTYSHLSNTDDSTTVTVGPV